MTHARGDAADHPTGPTHQDLPGSEVPEGALEPAELRAGDVRPGAEEVAPVRPAPARTGAATRGRSRPTRISGTWVAVIAGLVVLVVLLVFILQNLDPATVRFFGAEGSLPLAIAMLFSAIGGAVLVALIGGARILQLRKQARRPR
ncbi:lipopolysaccharide assembly protein LapA domain-containing protein [Amycolatopsis mongoliensis]|uniref:Lipopolysaccharide assembly protein LapA domain-containing protein n=1 Tax=Amycolatopsis mongoliensis TaxID=715475 RepID=A0A9Y2JXP8_9PSEU|nr:lipopolysaccharide assembly protein LapA domain-containing protein [Amycolatopsis sp. 4-36]WIY05202.1 lipopolysaccharide assembly protein LapA domain-containing protein [Amycolatopsis sp. 4-36]